MPGLPETVALSFFRQEHNRDKGGDLKMNKRAESRTKQAGVGTATMEPEGSAEAVPSQEEIAALAYSYWEARGRQDGSPDEDWLRAERELREQQSQGKP
jgi:hypothetical protein